MKARSREKPGFFLRTIGIIVLQCLMFQCDKSPQPEKTPLSDETVSSETIVFSYDAYDEILRSYVNEKGFVDYKGLKRGGGKGLFAALRNFELLTKEQFEKLTEEEKIALWINAYNIFTLKAIVDHYPIKPTSLVSSVRFPNNSIRQIPGVWTDLKFAIMGRKVTLEEIEHEILRKEFGEPRIHMAINCASFSCPPLLDKAFVGESLDKQLDVQSTTFLSLNHNFRIDKERNIVYLSSIFKWFGEDFLEKFGVDRPSGRPPEVSAVLDFVSRYITDEDRSYLETGEYKIEFIDYNWSLNEKEVKLK